MKKCPHCGMNIRDNVEVCGYCGGEISQKQAGAFGARGAPAQQRNAPAARPAPKRQAAEEPEAGEGEEEEGGLSKILQPGEQVLIGSLNVSVKKFFFHAYLTNKRIFLIDTQEKKLKVTAKDIPRDTIADSIVEYSENSDPVLVLSVKSADDEVKTMKLVFAQNGIDRSAEIDDWISLLGEEPEPRKQKKTAPPQRIPEVVPEEPVAEEVEEMLPPRPARAPARAEEMRPARKPLKEHERQPPVKRLIPLTREPEPEPEPEPVVQPVRRVQVRSVEEPPQRRVTSTQAHAIPTPVRSEPQPVRRPEVQTAVRTAMNVPVQPAHYTQIRPVKSTVSEPVRRPVTEPAHEVTAAAERPVLRRAVVPEEPADNPQFCHNCGKKLPGEANFCPGCGTRLGRSRTDPSTRMSKTVPRPAPAAPVPSPSTAQRKIPRIEEIRDEEEEEEQPRRPPVKKTPKGSDMTILQKFLRR